MKKTHNFSKTFFMSCLTVLAMGIVSCKQDKPIDNPTPTPTPTRTLSVNLNVVSDIATRAAATTAENRVDAFDVFLFDATSGLLEAVQRNVTPSSPEAGSVAGESKIGQVTFTVVGEGTKNILAVANGSGQVSLPAISVGITTYAQMLEATALLPSGGAPGSPFVMSGYANAVAADGSATLSLRRRVSKITVENLSAEDGLVINTLQIAQTADRSYLFQEGYPEEVTYVDYAAVDASGTTALYVYPQPAATNQLALTITGTFNGVDFSQSLPVQPASSANMGSNMQYAVKVSIDDAVVQLETTEQVVEEWGDSEDITGEIGLPANVLTKIPDPVFLAYCLSMIPSWDTNSDGLLTVAEAAAVTYIDVEGEYSYETYNYVGEIASLEGIEYFTGLRELTCYGNQLTALDLSKNTVLTDLWCSDNQLTSLDVSKNTALTYLNCSYNQLTSLDVSKNTALTSLSVSNNQLTTLDVSKNTALIDLSCGSNQLTALNVSNNTALIQLSCYSNQLTSLNVSNNTALYYLNCSGNQLTSLDVSKNTALEYLFCENNQLTSLDVSKNTALYYLYCPYNPGDGVSKFPVTAWFDNNSIPTGTAPSGNTYSFTTWDWWFNEATITPDYQIVN
ncbi:MAG: leucine-rich repeat domain-containing protein [Rikenellaceae bacterium]|jgi:hypothetical protein|nr:leucine-rich repeat domain-containing protein [Rikenellaceae bacterium]